MAGRPTRALFRRKGHFVFVGTAGTALYFTTPFFEEKQTERQVRCCASNSGRHWTMDTASGAQKDVQRPRRSVALPTFRNSWIYNLVAGISDSSSQFWRRIIVNLPDLLFGVATSDHQAEAYDGDFPDFRRHANVRLVLLFLIPTPKGRRGLSCERIADLRRSVISQGNWLVMYADRSPAARSASSHQLHIHNPLTIIEKGCSLCRLVSSTDSLLTTLRSWRSHDESFRRRACRSSRSFPSLKSVSSMVPQIGDRHHRERLH